MDQVIVRRLEPDAWQRYRAIRLAALADAPTAFSSTLARELSLTEERWRQRLANRGQFVALAGDVAIGLAGGVRPQVAQVAQVTQEGQAAQLVSMWVAPAMRGRDVGRLLVEAVVGWAAKQECPEVRLWVAEGNHAAERLYTRCSFRRTGTQEPMAGDDPARLEFEMVRPLRKESFGPPGIGHVGGSWQRPSPSGGPRGFTPEQKDGTWASESESSS